MIYREFQGEKLSLMGFGMMRLPLLENGKIDEAQVAEMVRYAMEHGINYYDTAYPYHGGESERVAGRVLKAYPRESYKLATKFPGHQIAASYDPKTIFEEQLEKCGVEYFDFYLLHNVYENSIPTYEDPKWGIIDYFLEQKKNGRIKHLGFSTHALPDVLEGFLERHGKDMEFCQIQLNYVDWSLQHAKEKYEMLEKYNIPVWVMEPLRGGKLANLDAEDAAKLAALDPDETGAGWALRWLTQLPQLGMILNGVSSLEQMKQNVATFEAAKPLSAAETAVLEGIAEKFGRVVPCTACRYCCDGCPMGLDIPRLMMLYNDFSYAAAMGVGMTVESMPEDKRPSACIGCGKCEAVCPQKIAIPEVMKKFAEGFAKMPSWVELCKKRDEEQAANRAAAQKA